MMMMVGSSNSRHVLNLCVFSQVSFFCRWKMRSITTCQSSIHRYEIDLYSLVDQTKKNFGFILYSFMEFIQHRRVCWMGFRTNPLIYKKVWNTSKNISKLDFFFDVKWDYVSFQSKREFSGFQFMISICHFLVTHYNNSHLILKIQIRFKTAAVTRAWIMNIAE